jgi:hypothetical protein
VSDEYETEPVPGLPELLPEGETILWQGSPEWKSAAREIMHADIVAGYFTLLALWPFASAWIWQTSYTDAVAGMGRTLVIGALAVGVLVLIAWLTQRTTIYTITTRRVVMRFGIALPMTINIPFTQIETAAVNRHPDGTGDLALTTKGPLKLAYLNLWPHARPWQVKNAEPTLRSIPNADQVAGLLAQAMTGVPVRPLIFVPKTHDGIKTLSQEGLTA